MVRKKPKSVRGRTRTPVWVRVPERVAARVPRTGEKRIVASLDALIEEYNALSADKRHEHDGTVFLKYRSWREAGFYAPMGEGD